MLQFSVMQQSRSALAHVGSFILLAVVAACAGEPAPEATGTAAAPGEPAETPAPPAEPAGARTTTFQEEEGPEGVRNYTRVDATVACAGATPPEAMSVLRERGFTTVINFRTAGERGASVDAGREAAEAAGLKYVHLPFREPTPELVESFLATVADPANQPVYIHCGSANRVGAMWFIKRVKQDGYSVDDALAEAEAIGLRSEGLKTFALEYVAAGA